MYKRIETQVATKSPSMRRVLDLRCHATPLGQAQDMEHSMWIWTSNDLQAPWGLLEGLRVVFFCLPDVAE